VKSVGVVVAGGALLLWGCSYHNVVYNAEHLFADAEAHRRAGRDSLSVAAYQDVVRRTGDAYRARPDEDWAAAALVLLGRSHLRLGDVQEASAAFTEASDRAVDPALQAEILVYAADARRVAGDLDGSLQGVNRALEGPLEGAARAEAHLLRGHLMLAAERPDQGWWDLDRAEEITPAIRVEAGLERLEWGVRHGDLNRTRRAIEALFDYGEGGVRLDSARVLVRIAEERWGAWTVAGLIEGADESAWDRTARGRMALERARMLDDAGDEARAVEQAFRVAAGLGESAAEARLLIATWRLAEAEDLTQAYAVRAILLPAGSDQRVLVALEAIDDLEAYASRGLDEALGWFAAAEVARDRLGADYLARGLFLAYADASAEAPWAAKAMLAALGVSPDEADRTWLRERLEAHGDSPYVLAAFGRPAAGFEALEEELEVRLRELRR
jgi:hypothetical protein